MKPNRNTPTRTLILTLAVLLMLALAAYTAFGEPDRLPMFSNSLTIGIINEAPVITQGTTASMTCVEDGPPQTLALSATDAEGDALTWSVAGGALGTPAVDGGAVTYTPAPDAFGEDSFTVTVEDAYGGDTLTVSVTIAAVNDPPVLPVCTPVIVAEDAGAQTLAGWAGAAPGPDNEAGQALTFTIWSNDNTALFATGGLPAISADGTLTFTPADNAHGVANLTLSAKDDAGGTDTSALRSVAITVQAVNDAPVNTVTPAVSGTCAEGETLTASAGTWNDDADGNLTTLHYAYEWQSAADADGSDVKAVGSGISLTLTAAERHRFIRMVETVTDTDESGTQTVTAASAWQQVENAVPAITEATATLTMDEDNAASLTLHATDADGDALTWSASTPAQGAASVDGGKIDYIPDADANGSDSFTVSVSDGYGGTDSRTVTVTVAPVNDTPTFTVGDDQTVAEDAPAQSVTGWVKAAAAGPANEADQTVEFIVTDNSNTGLFTASGQPAVAADGTLTFTPAPDAHGAATLTLVARDSGGEADTAAAQTFTITVEAVNDAPVNTALPVVSGTFAAGESLTATAGEWSDAADGDAGTLTYAWTWQTALDEAGTDLQAFGTGDGQALAAAQSHRYVRALVSVTDTDRSGTATAEAASAWHFVENTAPAITEADAAILTDEDTAGGIVLHATDADGDTLTWSATAPALGTAAVVDGAVTYTPNLDANGADIFTVTASDGHGGTDSMDVTVTIAAVNDAPAFTVGDAQTASEDAGAQTVSAWATAISAGPSDEAGQTVAFIVTDSTNEALFAVGGAPAVAADGTLTYTPAADANGSATLTLVAKDSGSGADTSAAQTFTITVTPVNDAPSFTKGADQVVEEDCGATAVSGWATALSVGPANEASQQLAFRVSSDNSALFTEGGQPAVSATGALTFTPAPNANGAATVTLYVQDDGGATATGDVDISPTQTFTITVSPVNDTPTFTRGADQTVAEDAGAQSVSGWATGISAGPADEAAQALAFEVTGNTNAALFATGGQPAVSPSGTLTYTPAQDMYGTATVTLRLTDDGDGANASATQSFTITVTAVNDAPIITGDATFTTDEDTAYVYAFTVTDAEDASSALTLAYNTGSTAMLKKSNMTLGGSGQNRTLTVLPEPDRNGDVNITITATDSQGVATTKTVKMTVAAVNDAPTISTIAKRATDEDTSTGAIGFTIGDVDTDLATCTVTVASDNPALVPVDVAHIQTGGSGAARTLTVLPAQNQSGTADITVTVSDGALTAQTTFTLTVNPVDDPPTITAIEDQAIDEDGVAGAIAFTLSDVDNAVTDLTVTAATANTAMIPRANIVLAPIGTDGSCALRVTPVADLNGTAAMTVTVRDPDGKLASESFVLTVRAVNDAPVLAAITDQTTDEDTSKAITVSVSDIDNTTAQLTLTATATGNAALLPLSGVTVAAGTGDTRTVTMTPVADQNGESTVTLTLSDGAGGTATRTFKLTVAPVNDKPRFTAGGDVTVLEDSGAYAAGWASGISTGAANETQSLAFSVTTDSDAMFATLPAIDAATGNLTFTPAQDACGVVTATVKLTDAGGASAAAVTFKIRITPVNDAPVAQSFAAAINTDEDQQVSGSLRASDVDGDKLTFELADGSVHGVTSMATAHGTVTLDAASGTFVYVPAKDYFDGVDTFRFRVYDGALYSGEAEASFDFTGVNDAPVAVDGTLSVNEDAIGTAGSLASLVTDVDSTTLTYKVAEKPDQGGTLTLDEATGAYIYTPASNYNGTERFTFRANDGSLYSGTATVTVTIAAVNDAPIAQSETVAVDEGQSLTGLFKALDVEEDAIAYAVVTSPLPTGFTFNSPPSGVFSFTAPFVADALDRDIKVTFSATDTHGDAGTGEITIRVRNVNRPPVRADGSPAVFAAQEDVAKAFNLGVTDPDGDALTYTVLSPVSHGTLSAIGADGSFTYQSGSNFSGTDRFTFMATDAAGLKSGIYTAIVTVAGVNDVPEVYDQYYFTDHDTLLSGIRLVGYDADGNSLTYAIKTPPASGTLTRVSNGEYTYQPAAGFSGDVSFTYVAQDGHDGESAPATVHIHVFGEGGTGTGKWVNLIPNQTIPQNTTCNVSVGTSNLTIQSVTATSANTWLLDASGVSAGFSGGTVNLSLTPKAYRTGQSVITVTVTDTAGATFVRTFILTVTRVNVKPTANSMTRTIDENSEMYEFVTGGDLNGDGLSFTLATSPAHGTLDFHADGTFHYVPAANFNGTDAFTFTVSDSEAVSDPATVTIHVDRVPIAPTAADQSVTTDEDTPVTGVLTGTEPHGESLTYMLVQNGRLGSAAVAADGSFTYTPNKNASGEDYFTFKTKGATGLYSAVARVSMTISPVNDTPVLDELTFTAYEDQAVSGYLKATDADVGDTLTYELVPTEGDLALGTLTLDAATGRFTYTPGADANGADRFHVLVRDASSSSAPVMITVNITPQNDAPRATDTTITVVEDSYVTASVAPFYTDVDGDAQTLSVVQSPAKGTITFAADGTYTYTPMANVNGVDYFTFRTRDSGGLSSNVALAKVVITPVNDVPTLSAPATKTINEDSHDQVFDFTIGDVEDTATALTVSAVWDTADIARLSFGGTGSNRWITVTPVDDFQSVTNITLTVADTGNDGTLSGDIKTASQTIAVTVEPVNDTPTINDQEKDGVAIHTAVTIDEDTSTGAIAFTVGDEETPAASLTVTGVSGNTSLVPASGVVIGGSGANRTVTVTPAKDKNGSVRITVQAYDGNTTRNAYVDVTVRPVNDAPTVNPPAAQTIPEDSATDILYYTIADIDSAVTDITMSATSSDERIVAVSGITLSGNGAERTVAVRPVLNAYGDVTITLTADDHGSVNRYGSATFVVHVTPVDDAPTIAAVENYTIDEDTATSQIPVFLSDIDDDAALLTLTGVSGNPALIDDSGIAFGTDAETGARYVVLTPKANQNGSALITLKATDPGKKFTTRSFTLTVLPVNDAPTISAIADQTILEEGATGLITFTVADIDNDVLDLAVTGAAADGTVIPTANIVISGNGAERTVKVTPAADMNGNIPVTLTVTDPGKLTGTSTFTVRITPVNDKPTFTVGANQTVLEDAGAQSVAAFLTDISRGKPNEAAQRLTFHVSADSTALFATDGQPAVSEDGTLTYTPAADQNGTATVTVYATDDGGTASGGADTSQSHTFTITVTPVNDQPSFEDVGNLTANEDATLTTYPWVKAGTVSVGPANESQTYSFVLQSTTVASFAGNTAAALFTTAPSINASTGAITFQPKPNISGVATLSVALKDNGGTANGGVDTSAVHTFTITVSPVDDVPVFTVTTNPVTVLEDSGAYSSGNASGIGPGGASDESGQPLAFTLTTNNDALFETAPAMTNAGLLTFKPAANANGSATVTAVLSDGNMTTTQTFVITVNPVNDAPSFTGGADQTVNEDAGAQSVTGWATALSKGPANESAQTLSFTVTNNNAALFTTSGKPAVNASGKLTYTPAANMNGSATVTVTLKDNGGVANSGADTSATYTFTITVRPVNDRPSFTDAGNVSVNEDSGAYSAAWVNAGSVSVGPANEAAQTRAFRIDTMRVVSFTGNTALFSVAPAIDAATGALAFTPMPNASGSAEVAVLLQDNGGTDNGGADTSTAHTFTITVNAVNDAPTYTLGGTVTVDEDSGSYSQPYATGITPGGGTDEVGQTLTFTLSGYTASLFETAPAISSSGQLTFKPAKDANGTTTVTVSLSDGITPVGGSFQIVIQPVNDQPRFTAGASQTVLEDSGAKTVSGWATGISRGATNESGQSLTFHVSNDNSPLFTAGGQPAVTTAGALSFTPAPDAYGVANVTLYLTDDGGTALGGVDTSASQTFTITVKPVNDQPSFTDGGNITVDEDSGAYSAAWANTLTLSVGPLNEQQTHTFVLQSTTVQSLAGNTSLFEAAPAIDPQTGAISFTPKANASGVAQLTAVLKDDDGVADGGKDTSAVHTFTITVRAGDDPPAFTAGSDVAVLEDSGAYSAAWATGITPGGGTDEAGQTLTFTLTGYDASLFAVAPAIAPSGTLTFRPADNANGETTATVTLSDGHSTATGTLTITVQAVNDAPTFTAGEDQYALEDDPAQTVAGWATYILSGPDNESAQTLAFHVSNDNTALFTADGQPSLDENGQLTYTPVPQAFGDATVSVSLVDDGGTASGGDDTSDTATFVIHLLPVNDQPSFTDSGDITVIEDYGPYKAAWADLASIYIGPENEHQTYNFQVLRTNENEVYGGKRLFAVAPAIDPQTGEISFTPALNANGNATVYVWLFDDDGVDNGGLEASEVHELNITVTAVDDAPSFTLNGPVTVNEDSGAYSQAGYLTSIAYNGGSDEEFQPLNFSFSGYDTSLFETQPAISLSGGVLSFKPAKDAYGVANITVTLSDGVNNVTHPFTLTIRPVNDRPSFADNGNVTMAEDSGAYSAAWAKPETLSVGPANETQTHAYALKSIHVDSLAGNVNLFETLPTIDADTGALRFTPKANASGVATLTAVLADNGGTDRGGVDTSETHTFTITVEAVNDLPTFTSGGNVTVDEDSGSYSRAWATNIGPGGGTDEAEQPLAFTLTGYDPALFETAPAVSADGKLTFKPAQDANGETSVTATLSDGVDTVSETFTITVQPVNDVPSFTKGANQTALEDSGAQTVAGWATAISTGPANEGAQTLGFVVSNGNGSLFTTAGQPAIDASGRLTYTPAKDQYGSATVTVALKDNGGTDRGGDDQSDSVTFTITLLPVNDQPTFTDRGNIAVNEDSGAYGAPWANTASVFVGPGNEAQAHTFAVTGVTVTSLAGSASLFAAEPAIDPLTGAVSFTPQANANGTATVTVTLRDTDGVDNGGVDTSAVHTFTITVNAVDDPPTFTPGAAVTVYEDGGTYSQPFATGITTGGGTDEAGQTLTFTIAGYNAGLFGVQPGLSSAGVLSFSPAADVNGATTATVTLSDGTNSVTGPLQITILPVNDAPSFSAGANQQVYQNAGPQSVTGWARGLTRGPANESAQGLTFRVSSNNDSLFASGGEPAVSGNGTLTYTPATDATGTATVTVTLLDSGGTDNGGRNQSTSQTFTITVLPADGSVTTTLGVTLDWTDANDKDGLRPATVTLYLLSGETVLRQVTLDAATGWAYTFTDLPMFDAGGQPIEYHVAQAAVGRYRTAYTYGLNTVHIENIHNAEPFRRVSTTTLLEVMGYDVPLGANSNMNEGDCFN